MVSNSNFEPILHNGPYNLFDQDLFPGMTKHGFLTYIYVYECVCVCVCV